MEEWKDLGWKDGRMGNVSTSTLPTFQSPSSTLPLFQSPSSNYLLNVFAASL